MFYIANSLFSVRENLYMSNNRICDQTQLRIWTQNGRSPPMV